jgi:hypothetical protein
MNQLQLVLLVLIHHGLGIGLFVPFEVTVLAVEGAARGAAQGTTQVLLQLIYFILL